MTLIETTTPTAERASAKVRKEEGVSEQLDTPVWKGYEKNLFRFFFIYFFLQAMPLDLNYYRELAARDWSGLHFSNFFYLARYTPRFFSNVPLFADWLAIFGIAAAGAFIWRIIEPDRKEYNTLYYWLRVLIRYRLAVALLAYGFIKFFPQQMPYPSISNLNTNYGDLSAWKIFSMSTGIVPGYQSFLGLIEIVAALLLLNRRTATIGAFIVLPFTGNVILSNLAYEGGEYVYGSLLVTFALFLVAYDAIRLYRFANELPVDPNRYALQLPLAWQRNARLILKSAFIFIFVFFYGYRTYASYQDNGYHYPVAAGLPGVEGIYAVKEFRVNNNIIPPSLTQAVRWRDVVFEKWATLSIRSNEPVALASSLSEEIYGEDERRNYEYAGNAGRHYYSYQFDTLSHKLELITRNRDLKTGYWFTLERPDDKTITLSGIDVSNSDSLHVVLERIDKKYLLEEATKQGRRRGLKL